MSSLTTTDQSRAPVPDPTFLAELIAEKISLNSALILNRREQLTSTRNFLGCLHEINLIKEQLRQQGYYRSTTITTLEEGNELVGLMLEDLTELRVLRDELEARKDAASLLVMELEKGIFELEEKINHQKALIDNEKEKKQRKRDCQEMMDA
ncbi:uncharacterized protein H6S33_008130 [Morchella sextelata]|uniref:uncharacterized protein n=1 Tax=Morchella sextelata TaxID=1174677 RepID=UPI001D04C404|nr:uncharacterized protein H6S33_008130 [Morchella sextelata]KAH0603126.1 hypothetical protein H6S33_008130 [Morchella sextelata]